VDVIYQVVEKQKSEAPASRRLLESIQNDCIDDCNRLPTELQIQLALSMDVKMASGFDASEAGLHGKNAEELVGLVNLGLSPISAIRAATLNAAELLGWQKDIGTPEPGKYADSTEILLKISPCCGTSIL